MENNQKFDDMLVQNLEGTCLPCSILKQVKPWTHVFKYIMWGYALQWLAALSSGFTPAHPDKPWLPLVGHLAAILSSALTYIGFRSLRNVNRCFFYCWVVKMLHLVSSVAEVGLREYALRYSDQLHWLSILINTIHIIFIWLGILCVQRTAGQSIKKSPAHLVLVYYAILILLPRIDVIYPYISPELAQVITLMLTLVSYFFIISLFAIFAALIKIPDYLDQIGYTLSPARVWLSPFPLCAACFALTIALQVISHILFNHFLL